MVDKPKYLSGKKRELWIAGALVLSIIFLIISMVVAGTVAPLLWMIPPALMLILLAFLAIDKFLLLTVFLVPLSIQLRFILPDTPSDIFIPTEGMLAIILILMIFKLLLTGEIERRILLHPVSIISYFLLGWYLVTSVTSTLPWISLKSFIARLWFFAGFYLLAAEIFRKPGSMRRYFLAYIAGMTPVVVYYLIRMLNAGIFDQGAAYSAVRPFFNDHTSFGAALALCIPIIAYLLTRKEASKFQKTVLSVLLLMFSFAFIFSYSRAAWLSLLVSGMVTAILLLHVSWKIIMPAVIVLFVFISVSWTDLMLLMNENRQESSGNIASHVQSIANIRSDASNMERINRWKCAIRMFREKPVFGWGPATYQFKYAPFQTSTDKTIISTNYGEGGNAHSEYLGSLADSGFTGMILYLLLLIISVRKGILIWKNSGIREIRYLALALVAGLISYAVHGFLNNFLDTDKISALFWGIIAAIVAVDVGQKEEDKTESLPEIGSDN